MSAPHAAATSGKPAPVSRKQRRRNREVRALQESDKVLARAPFERCVREALQDLAPSDDGGEPMRIAPDGVSALQCASEDMLNQVFESAAGLARHSQRDTILPQDMHVATKEFY